MSDEHFAECGHLSAGELLSQLDDLLWNHEEPYLEEIPMGKLPKIEEHMNDFARSMNKIENIKGYSQNEIDAIKEGILRMAVNPRDTQFQGFAYAVFEEMEEYLDVQNLPSNLPALYVSQKNALRAILARRAYDLVQHSLGYSLEYLDECGKEISGGMRIMPSLPDMAELPKEQE